MAKPRKKFAAKSRESGKRNFINLLVVALLIVAIFLVLEKVKKGATPPAPERAAVTEKQKAPKRPTREYIEHQPYTTVVPIVPKQLRRKKIQPGTVAIIIDDMGSSVREADELMAIGIPLTFSVIPGLAHVTGVVRAAHARGYQLMIHIPMEPQGYPQQRLESYGLLLMQSDDEIRGRLADFVRQVPYARGANNHMGSRFTEERGKMETVLAFLKEKGLFFIDSKTTPRSLGISLAGEMGVESASRNVFLDNDQDVAAIREQLKELAELARRKGAAIGICHPHEPTIRALAETMPELKRDGVNFVYAGDLVR